MAGSPTAGCHGEARPQLFQMSCADDSCIVRCFTLGRTRVLPQTSSGSGCQRDSCFLFTLHFTWYRCWCFDGNTSNATPSRCWQRSFWASLARVHSSVSSSWYTSVSRKPFQPDGRQCAETPVALFCLRTQSLNSDRVTGLLRAILKRKEMFWLMGFASCLGLFVEEKVGGKRRLRPDARY